MPTLYECTFPPEVRHYAEEVLHESEEERDERIHKIREWLQTQPHLNARTDVLCILRFLRGCKFNLEKTQRKMINFYKMRSEVPEWFSNRDPHLAHLEQLISIGFAVTLQTYLQNEIHDFQNVWLSSVYCQGVFVPLRLPDPQGRMVVFIRVAAHNPNLHCQNDVFKVGKMILDLAVEENELVSVYGVTAVFDLNGVTLGHALQMTPGIIKKAVYAWQDCYPLRTMRLDFINAPIYVNVILSIFRKFMREKMKKRITVHGYGLNSLHQVLPPEILPQEYGGSDGRLCELIDYWKQRLTEKREWFLEDEKYKADL